MSDAIDSLLTANGRTLEFKVEFHAVTRGHKRSQSDTTIATNALPEGRIPRVSRLMALAIKMDQLVRSGVVKDYAELARLGNVTRARISQIMDLLNLPPDVIENLLHLPLSTSGRDAVTEQDLREITRMFDWRRQRARWLSTFARDIRCQLRVNSAPNASFGEKTVARLNHRYTAASASGV